MIPLLQRRMSEGSLQILRGSFTSMTVRVCGLALAFLSHLVLSRTLGVAQYGSYVIALGWAMVLVVPARLGLDNSALRFATIYRHERQCGDFRGLVIFSLATIGLASTAIAAALLLGWWGGIAPLRRIDLLLLAGIAITIPFSALLAWLSALIRTANRIFAAQFYEQVLRPGLLIAAIVVLALAGRRLDASSAMLLTGLTVGIATIAIAVQAKSSFADIPAGHASLQHRKEWLSVSWVLFLMAAVQELLNQIDLILLGILGDATQAAHFAAAWRLASLVRFGLVAIATVAGPLIAAAYHRRDMTELARIARLSSRFSMLFALGLALLLALLGRPLLAMFGPGFSEGYLPLLIMLAGGVIGSSTGSVGHLMAMTGHQRQALTIFSGALVVSVILNVALIPGLGAVGSAIASSVALIAWNLAMSIFVRRKIGIDPTALGRAPHEPRTDAA